MGGDKLTLSDALRTAIKMGAPTYNKGDHRGCYKIYKHAAEAFLANRRLARTDMEALQNGLKMAAREGSDSKKAWAMRNAFDMILGDMPM